MLRHLQDPELETHGAPFSHVVLDDRYAFVAGVVAADVPGGAAAMGDIGRETAVVLDAIRGLLGRLGLTMDAVVRVDVHLSDLAQFDAMNQVYGGYFTPGREPARTCVEVRRLIADCAVEITCIARRSPAEERGSGEGEAG